MISDSKWICERRKFNGRREREREEGRVRREREKGIVVTSWKNLEKSVSSDYLDGSNFNTMLPPFLMPLQRPTSSRAREEGMETRRLRPASFSVRKYANESDYTVIRALVQPSLFDKEPVIGSVQFYYTCIKYFSSCYTWNSFRR